MQQRVTPLTAGKAPDRFPRKLALVCLASTLALLTGCVSVSNRPSAVMVMSELDKPKKVVEFDSTLSVDELFAANRDNDCGEEFRKMTSTAAVAGAYIPVSSSMTFSKDHGEFEDGRKWIVLRGDGMIHAAVAGIVLAPASDDGRTRVQVLVADHRQRDFIREKVEDGTLFCHWRKINYPYD